MEENNILIAKFMGFTLGHPDKNETRWQNDWFTTPTKTWGNRLELLHFDTDWNWLMAVVEKINQLGQDLNQGVEIKSSFVYLYFTGFRSCGYVVQGKRKVEGNHYATLLDCVYNVVVEFIKWYTLNK